MNTTKTLTNGRKVEVRNEVRKAGTLIGFATWEGKFIAIKNIKDV